MPVKAIYNILSNDSALSSKVVDRIYPNRGGQTRVFPSITYHITDVDVTQQKDVSLTTSDVYVQINVFAKEYNAVDEIGVIVRDLLHGYIGAGAYTHVQLITLDRTHDLFDEDMELNHRVLIFKCRIKH